MDREFLEKCIAKGLSLEKIGALAGKDPSTVGYHLNKHGLKAVGHDLHSPNGKVDPDRLRELIEAGASIHGVAEELRGRVLDGPPLGEKTWPGNQGNGAPQGKRGREEERGEASPTHLS